MATTVGRFALRVPTSGDNPDIPADFLRLATDLSTVALDDQGTLAARPVSTVGAPSNKPGRYWYVAGDPDPLQNGRLWRDTGAGWVEVAMNHQPVLASLPGSPTTGDEILFQTTAMVTAGVGPWHLRYDAALGGLSKWAVVSAQPWIAEVSASTTTSTASYVDGGVIGPAIALPVRGDYVIAHGAEVSGPTGVAEYAAQSFAVGATAASHADRARGQGSATLTRTLLKAGVDAVTLQTKHYVTSGSATWAARWIMATPERLG